MTTFYHARDQPWLFSFQPFFKIPQLTTNYFDLRKENAK